MKKLSEIKDNKILMVGGVIMRKKNLVLHFPLLKPFLRQQDVWTTIQHKYNLNTKDMLEDDFECEWDDEVWDNVTEQDIEEIQNALDRVFSSGPNVVYDADEIVEIDL